MLENNTDIAPSLLQPNNHAVLLIDYQSLQLPTARSHDPAGVVAAGVLLAFQINIPIWTLVTAEGQTQRMNRNIYFGGWSFPPLLCGLSSAECGFRAKDTR